ncbi:MAG TPA: hypothetical protein V6D15_16110 [Oculatellaceae cyanobacterium]|jgi:hypothetical protein
MSRNKRFFFYLNLESPSDRALASYCQNPPFPYRRTVELVRQALESFFLPFALYKMHADERQVLQVAENAIALLHKQANQIEVEIVSKLKEHSIRNTVLLDSTNNVVTDNILGDRYLIEPLSESSNNPTLLISSSTDKDSKKIVGDDLYRGMGYD